MRSCRNVTIWEGAVDLLPVVHSSWNFLNKNVSKSTVEVVGSFAVNDIAKFVRAEVSNFGGVLKDPTARCRRKEGIHCKYPFMSLYSITLSSISIVPRR
jgi:hypothetical protein